VLAAVTLIGVCCGPFMEADGPVWIVLPLVLQSGVRVLSLWSIAFSSVPRLGFHVSEGRKQFSLLRGRDVCACDCACRYPRPCLHA
jgi:hypothetical protein